MPETAVTRPTVVVTGPTRGLGRALVDVLLDRDDPPHLVLAGRSPASLAALAASVRDRGGSAEVLALDVSDLGSVEHAAEIVRAAVASGRLPRLRALVANAGGQFYDRRHTSAQGHEETFAANVLAQHALLRSGGQETPVWLSTAIAGAERTLARLDEAAGLSARRMV